MLSAPLASFMLCAACLVAVLGYAALAVYGAPHSAMERAARYAQALIALAIAVALFAALGNVN